MMTSVCIKNMLANIGYSDEHFSKDYSVQIDGTSAIRYDYVAFSDRYLKDVSTSCIAIREVQDDIEEKKYVQGAKYLAAPIVIISKKDRVRVWGIEPLKTTLLNDKEADIIHLYFEKNRFEFMSDTLINAKMGYRQLNIFEVAGLIDFSREATCRLLSDEFEKGLIAAKRYLKTKKKLNGQDLNNITSITMHVISALIINSKTKTQENVPDVLELITDLSQTYKEYFSDKLMLKYGHGLLEEIYQNLNRSINYQSVDHELLGYFYESTLLQLSDQKAQNIRREYGIYYTPRILSQEIVQSIPFENIPVNERYVLDGTCGSGSLLLSACRRLEELVRYEKREFERHDYLTKMIQGYDIDKFASEVARLSMLLYSLPYGNRWNVCAGDLLRVNQTKIQTPYIILGNPPYEEVRTDGQKKQKAVAFLDKYLEWLHRDGYIGIILPESFLQNDSSMSQREKLLKEFDIIELWILPGHVFENNCSTIVIIAQKKDVKSENLTKIKLLVRNSNSVKRYFKQRKWDSEFFINIQNSWINEPKFKMSVSPVEDVLQKIVKERKTIKEVTQNVMGIMLPSDFKFSKEKADGCISYIANATNFRKYVLSHKMREDIRFFDYHMSQCEEDKIKEDYAGLRLRRNYETLYSASNKVLIKMSSTPGEINCISALVDEEGHYPSHSFFVLNSADKHLSNYILCALLNSKLINTYVRSKCVKRTLTTSVIRSIPVPEFTDKQIDDIEGLFQEIKEAYLLEDEQTVNKIQNRIEDIILEAFNLTSVECDRVKALFDMYTKEGESEEHKNVIPDVYNNVSGQVENINVEEMFCDVYLAEFGEKRIKIKQSMPGWFLRSGAEFSAKYGEGELFDIKPLMYSYLDDDEMISLLNEQFTR